VIVVVVRLSWKLLVAVVVALVDEGEIGFQLVRYRRGAQSFVTLKGRVRVSLKPRG